MIGKTIGHYRVLRKLGEGGMSVVYEAEDTRLKRRVALKFISEEIQNEGEARERFQREARAASALNHPNLCTVYDVGLGREGEPSFIAMEFLEGITLEQLLGAGPISVERQLEIGIEIAEGLDAAHRRGLVHRDVKPSNIFLTAEGRIKVMDFGLAKLSQSYKNESASESADSDLLTRPGLLVGTVCFMSPEQARGEELDARSDLFSFGVVLYEMAVRALPFRGNTAAVIFNAILEREPARPVERNPDVPEALQDVILKALEKDPRDRYQSSQEMLMDLRRLHRAVTSDSFSSSSKEVLQTRRTGRQSVTASLASVPEPRRRYAMLAACVGAVLLAGLMVYWNPANRRDRLSGNPPEIQSIAVLPLENLSNDPDQDYFADGMTDELITKLSQISALRVISRTSVSRYRHEKKSLPQIARELDVEAVVEGSVLRSRDRVRINAKLVDAIADRQIWAESYERDLTDVLALQSDVANAIVREVRIKVAAPERLLLADSSPIDPVAYELYLRGRSFFVRFTPESLFRAVEYFERAIEKNPGYELAYAGIADAYVQQAGRLMPPHEAMPKARAAALEALKLNPRSSDGHAALAQVKLFYDFDWSGAGAEFRQAAETSQRDPLFHQIHSLFLSSEARWSESIEASDRALRLDPASSVAGCVRARVLYYARRFQQAIDQYETTLEMDPRFTGSCVWQSFALQHLGRYDEAVAVARHAHDASPSETLPISAMARAHGVIGEHEEAERLLGQLLDMAEDRFVSPHDIGMAYAGWNREEAIAWLSRAYEARLGLLVFLKVDAAFDDLRSDGRFRELMRRMGVPQ